VPQSPFSDGLSQPRAASRATVSAPTQSRLLVGECSIVYDLLAVLDGQAIRD